MQESAFFGLDEEITRLTDILTNAPYSVMERLAVDLKSRDIEILLHAFACVSEPVLLKKMEFVIRKRFRRKLFHLGWVLVQGDYTNGGLLHAMKLLMGLMRTEQTRSGRVGSEHPEDELVALLKGSGSTAGDYLTAVSERLCVKGTVVNRFFSKYSIIEDSLFGSSLLERFFIFCDKEDFISNKAVLMKYFHRHSDSVVLFSCYLDKFETQSYSRELLGEVLAKWGLPAEDSDFWRGMSSEHIGKVNSWLDYKNVEDHFGSGTRKFEVWAAHFNLIKRVITIESCQMLAMDFGVFVAVDIKGGDGYSYLYDKDLFEREYHNEIESIVTSTAWQIDPELVGNIKKLYINGVKMPIYCVGYEKADILYIKQILKNFTESTELE